MNYLKISLILFLSLYFLISLTGCSNRIASDRYLKMKVKPSNQLRVENKEVLEKGNKAYKKQLEINKKDLKENNKK